MFFYSVTEIILCFQNTDNVNFYNIMTKEVPEVKSNEQGNLHLSKLYLSTWASEALCLHLYTSSSDSGNSLNLAHP